MEKSNCSHYGYNRSSSKRRRAKQEDAAVNAYMKLIENARSTLLVNLAIAFREQSQIARDVGKIKCLHFDEHGKSESYLFTRSEDLKDYLDKTETKPKTTAESATETIGKNHACRRIFILEDISRHIVGVLGSRLRIHPSVFARHLADLSFLESVDELFPEESDTHRFTLPYPHFANAPTILDTSQRELEELYRMKANVRRFIAFPKPFGTFDLRGTILELECCVSYWSKQRPNGGWDVLLLVDPPLGEEIHFVNSRDTLKIKRATEGPCTPNFARRHDLPLAQDAWAKAEAASNEDSMFDRTVAMFERAGFIAPDNPFECTTAVRTIALRGWNHLLNHAIHCLILTKGEPYMNNTHFSSPISTLWAPNVEEWLLGRMVKWSRRLHMEYTVVGMIIRSLGADRKMPQTSRSISDLEATKWLYVRDKMLEYKSLYDDMASSYMQVMSLRESQTSNAQARSVARISFMGSIFFPISLVSGIFSMAPPFGPGGDEFWVFAAVASPLLVLLVLWLFPKSKSWLTSKVSCYQPVRRKSVLNLPSFRQEA